MYEGLEFFFFLTLQCHTGKMSSDNLLKTPEIFFICRMMVDLHNISEKLKSDLPLLAPAVVLQDFRSFQVECQRNPSNDYVVR